MARTNESVSRGQNMFGPVTAMAALRSQRKNRTPRLPQAGPSHGSAVSMGKGSGLISRRDAASIRVCSRDTSSDTGRIGASMPTDTAAMPRVGRSPTMSLPQPDAVDEGRRRGFSSQRWWPSRRPLVLAGHAATTITSTATAPCAARPSRAPAETGRYGDGPALDGFPALIVSRCF